MKVTALVLSAVLWAVVAAEEPTTEIIPVSVEVAPPEGRTLTRSIPRVQALYSGSARELFKLYGEPPRINKSIPDTLSLSAFTLDLSVADLLTPPDVDVNALEVQPRLIRIELDDAVERDVPVVSQVSVEVDTGFALLGNPRLAPDSVTVRGPSALVQAIQSVPTIPMSITGLQAPARRTVPIDTTGLGVVRVVPAEVDAVVDVAEIATRLIIGVPVVVQAGAPGDWEADPMAIAVTVRGVEQRLAGLTRDSVNATAVISGESDEEVVSIQLTPPPGLTATATPDSVLVRRRND